MPEPRSLAAILADQMKQLEPGTREYNIRQQIYLADLEITECRRLILSNPDLAARLCQPPLDYARPDQWNGFVPPETFNGERNNSPRHEALMSICAEAGTT